MPSLSRTAWAVAVVALLWGPVAAGQAEARIVLRWSPVASAARYELQIATDEDFRGVVVDTRTEVNGYRWASLPTRLHFWRVRSFDAAGRAGEWSKAQTIAAALLPPTPLSPADGATLPFDPAGVTVELAPQPTLARTILELSRSAEPTDGARRTEGPGPELSTGPLEPGTWFWRLRGVGVNGERTEPSPPRRFTVLPDAPRWVQPAGEVELPTAEGARVVLRWTLLAPASRFRVEVQQEGGGVTSTEVAGTSDLFVPRAAGRYLITVRALEGSGIGPASAPRVVSVGLGRPRPLAPAEGEVIRVPERTANVELSWSTPVAGAEATVELLRDGSPPTPAASAQRSASGHWLATGLPAGAYAWRVTTRDRLTRLGVASHLRRFRVETLSARAAPTLVEPDDAVAFEPGPVDFGWLPLPGATGYELRLVPEEAGPQVLLTSAQPHLRVTQMLRPGRWQWQVRGTAAEGPAGDWSSARRLLIGPERPLRLELSVIPPELPADGHSRAELRLRLSDAKGRPVLGVRPTVRSAGGSLGPQEPGEDPERRGWIAPAGFGADGRVQLSAQALEATATATVRLWDPRGRWLLGLRAGGFTTLGALLGPSADLELTSVLPALRGRLRLSGRLGVRQARFVTEVPPTTASATGTAWIHQVSLVALLAQPAGAWTFCAGVGALGQLVDIGIPQVASVLAPAVGAQAHLEASFPLGGGEVSLELTAGLGELRTPRVQARTTGLAATLGYRVLLQ